jgi:hypothetical protein
LAVFLSNKKKIYLTKVSFLIFAVSPSGVAGVLVPIFIVIAILGSALGYYMHRNRRLKRNFMAFASRYSPATGAAILNAVSNW